MGSHCNEVNILLGGMIKDFFCIIPISHMAVHFKSFSFKSILNPLEVFLCLLDDLHLSFGWIGTWEGVSIGNPQKGNTCFQFSGQLLDHGKNVFSAFRSVQRNKNSL